MTMAEPYEGAVTAEHPRLTLLREFLELHFRMAPNEKMDGQIISKAWTVWASTRGAEPRPMQKFYADLRYFGFMVKRGASNKTFVYGIAPKIHLRGDLETMSEAWDDQPTNQAERDMTKGIVTMANAAVREAIEIKREVVETILANVLRIAEESLDDRVKLQAYEMLLCRSFPKLATRTIEPEPEEEVIEVEVVDRPSLDEVEAAIKKRWGQA